MAGVIAWLIVVAMMIISPGARRHDRGFAVAYFAIVLALAIAWVVHKLT